MPRGLCVAAAALLSSLLLGLAARADTTVSFYSHGWGLRADAYIYFPHAFVVVERAAPADPPEEAYGFTSQDQGPDALVRPTPGMVEIPRPDYRRHALLHFTVAASDDQYRALRQVVSDWGGPAAPLYDLERHNCVGFVAAIAQAVGLETPAVVGEDPVKFLGAVRRLNPGRLVADPPRTSPDPPRLGPPPAGSAP